jgi:uncharacterized membrane protein (UPF0182 family)
VATDPGTSVSGNTTVSQSPTQAQTGTVLPVTTNRIDPFYQLLQLPDEQEESFVMSRPFVPFSAVQGGTRQLLTSFMVADSDPESYGEITVFEMPSGTEVNGPLLANTQVQQNPKVSFITTQLNQQGSRVEYGNMLLVPLDTSILYVRPLYVSSDSNPAPALKAVIVVWGNQVSIEPTLREALLDLFPDSDPQTAEKLIGSLPEYSGADGNPTEPDGTTGSTTTTVPPDDGTPDTTVPAGDETVDQLIALGLRALDEADAALTRGDLAGYQAKVEEARGYLTRAAGLIGAPSSTSPETTVPSTIDPSTTTTIAEGTPA